MVAQLAAVAAGEEGVPVTGDSYEYPWWLLLPGMNWRARSAWPTPGTTNAICAAACIIRLVEVTGRESRLGNLLQDVRKLRDWLDEAEGDEAAYHRRVTLCLVMSIATSRTEPQHLVGYAKTLLGT
jgi:hypothetical protein